MVVKKKIISKSKVAKKTVKKSISKNAPSGKVRKSTRKKVTKNNIILENNLEAKMPEPIENYEKSLSGETNETVEHDVLYSWDAPEFLYHEKSLLWHVVVYSILLLFVGLMFLLKQWVAIPVFLLIAILIYQYAEVKPKNVAIAITNLGVIVGDKFYPFSEIKSFWVLYNPPIKQVSFELTKRFSPVISVSAEGVDLGIIKDIISSHVVEDDTRTEDFMDRIIRYIRF